MPNAKQNLVIVESPSKAKTIGKYLGPDYQVKASMGHLRDLPKSTLSVDIEHDFEPEYYPLKGKEEIISELQKAAKHADRVYLATDPDREGEAISWHLKYLLNIPDNETYRVTFNEITRNVVQESIQHPRPIDQNLVDAQQARRVLDRIVGYQLSPLLWKKIRKGLSAGRVQSVATRLVVDRENEIRAFVPQEYWTLDVNLNRAGKPGSFTAHYYGDPQKRELTSEQDVQSVLDALEGQPFSVTGVKKSEKKRTPAPPFITSTLQQEASRKLNMTPRRTMMIAQQLYEGVEISGEGSVGLITYMRTDSVNLSSLALGTIKEEIATTLGDKYYKARNYHTTAKGAQEAHEAIRPTYISHHEISGTAQEKRLYDLIWKRTIATQMADAELEKTTAEISIGGRQEKFVATGEVIKFDGFLHVYMESSDDESNDAESDTRLPELKKGETLALDEIDATQRYTQQPPRYSEAMLVKKLEELGIGRPSTYAPTISTIQNRDYVEKGEKTGTKHDICLLELKNGKIKETKKEESYGNEKNKLIPTDVGMVVNDFLMEYFPDIMDYNFTANVEEKFDHIAEGQTKWNDEIANFYKLFHPEVEKISNLRLEHKVGERVLGTDPKTGKEVSVKIGRFGPLVQLGSTDSEEKPQFASLQKGQSVSDITLEEALKLFELPRTLGDYEGETVTVAIGRFGPYVKHGKMFVSVPKTLSPQTITLDEAVELIKNKAEAEKKRLVKTFDEEPEMEILNGPYGVYISYKKKNYKIPKDKDAAALSLDDCRAIIEEAANAPKKPRRTVRRTTKKS